MILDLSRLVYAAWERTPKGIPRVELAYAQHFMASDADRLHVAVLDAFGRLRLVDKPTAEAFVAAIAHYWEHDIDSAAAHWRMALRALWIHLVLIARPWGALEQLVGERPGRFLYIIPSQLQLDRPALIETLKRAGDLKLVFFVHDILPSLFPISSPTRTPTSTIDVSGTRRAWPIPSSSTHERPQRHSSPDSARLPARTRWSSLRWAFPSRRTLLPSTRLLHRPIS